MLVFRVIKYTNVTTSFTLITEFSLITKVI